MTIMLFQLLVLNFNLTAIHNAFFYCIKKTVIRTIRFASCAVSKPKLASVHRFYNAFSFNDPTTKQLFQKSSHSASALYHLVHYELFLKWNLA